MSDPHTRPVYSYVVRTEGRDIVLFQRSVFLEGDAAAGFQLVAKIDEEESSIGLSEILLEDAMSSDVPGEDDATHDARVLELELELASTPARLGSELDRVAEPGRLGVFQDLRQDELVRMLRERLGVPGETLRAHLPELVDLVHLTDAEGGATFVGDEAVGIFFEDEEAVVLHAVEILEEPPIAVLGLRAPHPLLGGAPPRA